jgi:hypothetical protein
VRSTRLSPLSGQWEEAKVVCVLYDNPVDGYPPEYARDDIPNIDHEPDGMTTPTYKQNTEHFFVASRMREGKFSMIAATSRRTQTPSSIASRSATQNRRRLSGTRLCPAKQAVASRTGL